MRCRRRRRSSRAGARRARRRCEGPRRPAAPGRRRRLSPAPSGQTRHGGHQAADRVSFLLRRCLGRASSPSVHGTAPPRLRHPSRRRSARRRSRRRRRRRRPRRRRRRRRCRPRRPPPPLPPPPAAPAAPRRRANVRRAGAFRSAPPADLSRRLFRFSLASMSRPARFHRRAVFVRRRLAARERAERRERRQAAFRRRGFFYNQPGRSFGSFGLCFSEGTFFLRGRLRRGRRPRRRRRVPESLLQELAVGGVFGKWVLNNRRSTEGAVRAFRVGRGGVHDVLVVGAARRGKRRSV